ncbi:MAG: chorismate synthase [Kiritimatiellae bacterium]|nr:chorismate synthase [Kiritimatiellia bacterium]
MKMFGQFLRVAVEGASHSRAISFKLENFPSGFVPDFKALSSFMARRAPGQGPFTTARWESDAVTFLSGFGQDGASDGSPILGEIQNRDMRPRDYGVDRTVPRPGHADFGQWVETGTIPTGGGKNSGRLTAPLCAVGALCLQMLKRRGISISAHIDSIAGKASLFNELISAAKRDGDSVGGTIVCEVKGLRPGLGGALFDGLESHLSAAIFAIPGVKGIEFGEGFRSSSLRGSENNDPFVALGEGRIETRGNKHGGILGGRTSGMPVVFRVALKPTPTIFKPLDSVDLKTMTSARSCAKGRHDPCIVLRAVPVVEALAAFVVLDMLLAEEALRPRICLTLTGSTLKECAKQFEAERYFVEMVELRADLLSKRERAKVCEFPSMVDVPALLTYRRASDGGAFEGDDGERKLFFRNVLESQVECLDEKGFEFVDFEEGFAESGLIELAHKAGAKVVCSIHDFNGPVRNLTARLKALSRNADIAKVAFMPHSLDDVTRVFAQLGPASKARGLKYVVVAMGHIGFSTRVLARRLGSLWTYTSVKGLSSLGHVTPHELVKTYRFRQLDDETEIYGVTGWPLEVTRSPEINNAAFSVDDKNAVMVPMPSKTPRSAVRFMSTLGLKAMAVTIPHKFGIMPHLKRIDKMASKVGAVNTVVREKSGLVGYNTDVAGITEALEAFAGNLRLRRVAVLGDGGAAQAVKFALSQMGAKYEVFHRTMPEEGFDLIINCTPVNPIVGYKFTGRELVYDLRYNPETTPLMAEALKAGCRVQNGFSMLVHQAAEQRKIYCK